MAEFDGIRAKLYDEALTEYPLARCEDISAMKQILSPKEGEKILGFGEGNGFFCQDISDLLGKNGKYFVTDPSLDQLNNLKRKIKGSNIQIVQAGAENLNVPTTYFDKAWSFGALHHCPDKISAFKNIFNALKFGGTAFICDVFQGSNLAKHFDIQVDKYCITGHKVTFLSDKTTRAGLVLAGFKEENIKIKNLNQKWIFNSEDDMGKFIYKLHAMTKIPGTEKHKGKIYLNWPMKVIIAKK